MKAIQKIKGGGYAQYLSVGTYYLGEDGSFALTAGTGASQLGLSSHLTRKEFSNLLEGFSPDGSTPLVQNAGSSKRQKAWDLPDNAPKTVSVAFSQSDPQERQQFINVILEASRRAFRAAERNVGYTRRGVRGRQFERAGLVAALVPHISSRAGDPHLHAHVVVFNLCKRRDGTTGTIVSKPLYCFKMQWGRIFRSELANMLERELGFELVRTTDTFEIKGVPQQLSRHFSKRRAQIEDYLLARNESSAADAGRAAIVTRPAKPRITQQTLFAKWQQEADSLGWGPKEAKLLFEQARLRVIGKEERQLPKHGREIGSNEKLGKKAGRDHPKEIFRETASAEPKSQRRLYLGGRDGWGHQRTVLRFAVEQKTLFPRAPKWSPVKNLRLPALSLRSDSLSSLGRFFWDPHPRLGKIMWQKGALVMGRKLHIYARRNYLFPNAPFWSPARRAYLPVLGISVSKSLPKPFWPSTDLEKYR